MLPFTRHYIIILLPNLDILVGEFTSRFNHSQHILPALNLLPSAVVSSHWKDRAPEWIENVAQSLSDYIDDLPSPESLKTELMCWRLHW